MRVLCTPAKGTLLYSTRRLERSSETVVHVGYVSIVMRMLAYITKPDVNEVIASTERPSET
jgi:hypothetical protein